MPGGGQGGKLPSRKLELESETGAGVGNSRTTESETPELPSRKLGTTESETRGLPSRKLELPSRKLQDYRVGNWNYRVGNCQSTELETVEGSYQ